MARLLGVGNHPESAASLLLLTFVREHGLIERLVSDELTLTLKQSMPGLPASLADDEDLLTRDRL